MDFKKDIFRAVYEIDPRFLSKICNTPKFEKIIESVLIKIVTTDYLKFWQINEIFKDYKWYNEWKFKAINYTLIDLLMMDDYFLSILKLLKPVSIYRVISEVVGYIGDNSNYTAETYMNMISEVNPKKSFTKVIFEHKIPVILSIHNRYLCTDCISINPKPIIKVHKYEICKKFCDTVIICLE